LVASAILVTALEVGCTPVSETFKDLFCKMLGAGVCSSSTVEVTLFHTNDIHSHLLAPKSQPFGLGGAARLRTLLNQRRAATRNPITIDAGDWSEGTWFYELDTGANMLRTLKLMGYDAVCLGNHDFLNGPDQVLDTIHASGDAVPVLAANLTAPRSYARREEFRQTVKPEVHSLVTPDGIRVGIIGLTTYEGLYNSYLEPVQIDEPVLAATREAIELWPQTDLLVLVSHNSFDVNTELAKLIPGIDVVVSGHSHVKTPQPTVVTNVLGNQVPVVEAGEWGEFLGELTLIVEPGLHRVSIKNYQLHPVSPDLPEDPEVAALVADQTSQLSALVGDDVTRVVADADFDLDRSDTAESPLGNLLASAYREAVPDADLALEPASLTGGGLARGPLTLMDLHDAAPHLFRPSQNKEWTIYEWDAEGEDLSQAFQTFFTITAYLPVSSPLGWLDVDNALLTWEPDAELFSVDRVLIGSARMKSHGSYKVAISEGFLDSLKQANDDLGLGMSLKTTDTGIETWQAVAQYAKNHQHLTETDLGVGGRVRTPQPDLALYGYTIQWDGHALSAQVQNQGLGRSRPGQLSCSFGVPDAPELDGTSAQQWTPIGYVPLPPLDSGATLTVSIPWEQHGVSPGHWPVQCATGQEGLQNHTAEHVFVVRPP
jgi:2',3'-cyclic-nucleotide 2'-phosphodiesterase (5'-nucleotidase family)